MIWKYEKCSRADCFGCREGNCIVLETVPTDAVKCKFYRNVAEHIENSLKSLKYWEDKNGCLTATQERDRARLMKRKSELEEGTVKDRWYGKQFNQDKAAHQTYAFAMDAGNIPRGAVDEVCIHCGGRLQVYYCEERLCLVRCLNCGIMALTEASNHSKAAQKTIGVLKE